MQHTKITALSLAVLGLGTSQVGHAVESDAWQYEVTPYFLAAGMEGTVGVRGVTSDVDVSFNDIMDSFDQGFMGFFSARKGPWSYSLEAVYMKLEDAGSKSVTGPFGNVSVSGALQVTSKMYIYQGTVGYRVLDGTTTVDAIGALRYTKLEADMDVTITTTPAIVFPGGTRSAGGSVSWTDAVVGAVVHHPVSDNVSLLGYVDVGGGGSDLTYQLIAGANWEFNKGYTAKVGYRYLDWDYEEDGTVWDIAASGPYLGLGIAF
ncbi:MAG: hypothetical protein HZB57_05150 [Gammaproteobacteria bacterium]|nr:hypothetical protein [Gammaproteobacteria bacterium]